MMKKIQFLLLLLLFGYVCTAQKKSVNLSIPSHNAISLGSFGSLNGGTFNGSADISIPLYEIKGLELNVPIELRYNAQGVMPEVHPGWVGQNWSLSAGGIITREVKGSPDESTNISLEGIVYKGYFYNPFEAIETSWNDIIAQPSYHDYEPDIFNFNFLGFSGYFYLGNDGKWQVQSNKNIKVVFDKNTDLESLSYLISGLNGIPADTSFYRFTLIDEYGNQYIFGGNQNALEYSYPISNIDSTSANPKDASIKYAVSTTSWYLTKIISSNRIDEYQFDYERGPFTLQLFKSYETWKYTNTTGSLPVYCDKGSLNSPVYLKEILHYTKDIQNSREILNTNLQFEIEASNELKPYFNSYILKEHSFLNCWPQITYFTTHGGMPVDGSSKILWLKLNNIIIRNVENKAIKIINLNYNDSPQINESLRKRLFLDSLNFISSNESPAETKYYTYKFKYYNRDLLQNYNKTISDHWGYNNGSYFLDNSSIPADISIAKAVNDTALFHGILSEIVFPTGGKTKYVFESHKFAKAISNIDRSTINIQSGMAGGLRIRKISSCDMDNNDISKDYYYVSNILDTNTVSSSGVLNVIPVYSFNILSSIPNFKYSYSYSSSNAIIPLLSNNNGCHVNYSSVIEVTKRSGKIFGIKKSNFTNHDNGFNDLNNDFRYGADFTFNFPCNSRAFERGRILEEIYYDNQNKIINRISNIWERLNFGDQTATGIFINYIPVNETGDITIYHASFIAYRLFSYPFLLKEQQIYDYGDDDNVTTSITRYNYNNNKQVIRTEKFLGDGTSLIEKRRYADDFVGQYSTGTLAEWNVLKNMVNSGMLAYPIEVTKIHMTVYGLKKVIGSEVYIYEDTLSKKLLTSYFRLNSTNIVDSLSFSPLNIGRNSVSVIMDPSLQLEEKYIYNGSGQIREVTSRDGFRTSYLWGYNNMYPIAKINNSSYSNVEEVLGFYEVSRLANGIPKRYEIEHMSNILRSSPLLQNSQVTAYSYIPQIGMELMISPNGTKTQYSYDGFSRLNTVRDNKNNIKERLLYHYQNNNDFENVASIYSPPQTFILTCTSSIGGSLATTSRIVEANATLNLYSEIPATEWPGFEFDGYYVDGIRVTNPNSYLVQSNATINARFAPVAQDFDVTVTFGPDQLIESSYAVEIISSAGGTALASQIISPNDSILSCLINNSNFPIVISVTTRALLPSLRIKVDEVVVFENFGPVPPDYNFVTPEISAGQHTITIETP